MIGWEQLRAEFVYDIRWWPLDDIDRSPERFVPAQLAPLLRRLLADGPPGRPLDVGT